MILSKVDILAIGVHPDDVELSCSGTLLKGIAAGKKVGLLDLTKGELGTRGSAELRLQEAELARQILGAEFRINLGLKDGFFENNEASQRRIIEVLRACQPDVVLCNALRDRHPDHGRSAELEKISCFLAGLRRIVTTWDGKEQQPWRPKLVLHYIQDYIEVPSIVVDVTDFWPQRMESVKAYSSQFYDPNNKEPQSSISTKAFIDSIDGKGLSYGRFIGVPYGEGFISERPIGIDQITSVF